MVGATIEEQTGLWGSSGSDVYSVGTHWEYPFFNHPYPTNCVIQHFDGSSWSLLSRQSPTWVNAVWGRSVDDFYFAGAETKSTGAIARFHNQTWRTEYFPNWDLLNAIDGGDPAGDADVFAVGDLGSIVRCDGSSCTPLSRRATGSGDLHGVWGSSPTDVFAVGLESNSPIWLFSDEPIIVHFDGISWSEMPSPAEHELWGIWGSSAADVFAVGSEGNILHYNGLGWSAMASGTTWDLYGVWGASSSDVFAVGFLGTILHYDGQAWSAMDSGTTTTLWGVGGHIAIRCVCGRRRRHIITLRWFRLVINGRRNYRGPERHLGCVRLRGVCRWGGRNSPVL